VIIQGPLQRYTFAGFLIPLQFALLYKEVFLVVPPDISTEYRRVASQLAYRSIQGLRGLEKQAKNYSSRFVTY